MRVQLLREIVYTASEYRSYHSMETPNVEQKINSATFLWRTVGTRVIGLVKSGSGHVMWNIFTRRYRIYEAIYS